MQTCLRHIYSLLFAALIIITISSCGDKEEKKPPTDNTTSRVVFVYMAAENNLSSFATTDINEMLQGCKMMSDNDKLIIFLDNATKGKAPCYYEITNKTTATTYGELTPVFKYDQEYNSASAETLDMTLAYLYSHYSADSYGIIFWSHGSGWTPYNDTQNTIKSRIRPLQHKSFGVDTGSDNAFSSSGSQMDIDDMAQVLCKYKNIDFILFDACFMQSIETAYELSTVTRHIIASPTEIPGPGAPYARMILPMFADQLNINNILLAYYSAYQNNNTYGVLISAVDCSQMEDFARTHARIYKKYQYNIDKVGLDNALNYFIFDRWSKYNEVPDAYDMKGVMQTIVTDQNDLNEWLDALSRLIPHSYTTDWWYSDYEYLYVLNTTGHHTNVTMPVNKEQYGGISMYVPQDKYQDYHFYNAFYNTTWAKATGL